MNVTFNRTKIVATLGPSSVDEKMMRKLIETGVDVFRLNFSHGEHEDKQKAIEQINRINEDLTSKVAILCDLQGPKIRLGDIEGEGVMIESGKEISITNQQSISSNKQLYVNYEPLPSEVKIGDRILIDDGKLELKVLRSDGKNKVIAEIIYGGIVKSRKGVNLPDTSLSVPSLTEKDKIDLTFILTQDIDWIALSFVRYADDIIELKKLIDEKNHPAKVIAKIEKPEALTNIKGIIQETDGVMVARGDLGVEVAGERVPLIQKDIVKRCLKAAKPVIIATQMMESMIENPKPTRAEINDVANAVLDGADAVMLSGETAVGDYPVEVINHVVKILDRIESKGRIYNKQIKISKTSDSLISDAICHNASIMANELMAKAIVGMTFSGYTAYRISSHRPRASIFIFTANKKILRTLNLVWGVRVFHYDKFVSTDETVLDIKQILKESGYLRKGDVMVNLGSMPIKEKGKTNMIRVSIIS